MQNPYTIYPVLHEIHNLGLSSSELIFLVVLFKLRREHWSNRFTAKDEEISKLAKISPHTVRKAKKSLRAKGIINWWVEDKLTKYTLSIAEAAK